MLLSTALFIQIAMALPELMVTFYSASHAFQTAKLYKNGTFVFPAGDINYCKIGNSANVLRVWSPFIDATVVRALLGAGNDLVLSTLASDGSQTVSVEVQTVEWSGVASTDVCKSGAEKCADIIILGTTQVAARVAARDLLSLNSYFGDYSAEYGQAFSETFLQKYFFDYFYVDGWMAIPFVTDVRVQFY